LPKGGRGASTEVQTNPIDEAGAGEIAAEPPTTGGAAVAVPGRPLVDPRPSATRPWFRRARRRFRRSEESGFLAIREGERPGAVLSRDTYFRRALAIADVLALAATLGIVMLSTGSSPRPEILLALPLMVLLCKVVGLYDRDEHVLRKTTLDEVPRIFHTAALMTLALALLDRTLFSEPLGRGHVVELWALLLAAMCTFRVIARWSVMRATPAERCLVLGRREAAERIKEKLQISHSMKAVLVGRVRIGEEARDRNDPEVLGPIDDLDYIIRSEHVDRVIIAPTWRDNEETLDTIRVVKALGVKVSVLPRLFEVIGSSVEFDDCDGITLLGVRRYGLSKSSTFLKRAFDIAGALAALLLCAPLLVAIAIAVKVTSHGPVFFRQERIGRGGITFRMFKFRTMVANAEEVKPALVDLNEARGLFKISDDPRLTRVGRLLRRCSLDELPQLFNVLRGEMSLVGPRPLVPEEDSRIEGWQRRRLDVTPGMTGVWQVLGSSRVPLHEMVKVDYIYRTNWSIWLDIKILLRTVPLVVLRRNL
jgi:exopolysaccharide biosynthesis polyprenyl glycosylphosphotransferase